MKYNMAVIHCVRVQCSVEQALRRIFTLRSFLRPWQGLTALLIVTKNRTWQDCGFNYHDESATISWVPIFLFGVVTLFFVGRLATKWMGLSTWGWDDWTIVFAYVRRFGDLRMTIGCMHG